MCTISYKKCVCFLLLVILAVLSCSGFRIDNLAMTDISKRNSHTSTSLLNSDDLLARLFTANSTHRIRHHRQVRPSSPVSNSAHNSRRRKQCPELDISWKTYKSDAVAVAKIESKRANCKENCRVQFRVIEWLKNRRSYDDTRLRLNFRMDKPNCEYDDVTTNRSPQFSLKTRNETVDKPYILFLNITGHHDYAPLFAPIIKNNRTLKIVKRVNRQFSDPHFKPKLGRLVPGESRSKRLKLTCRVRGFPIPIIYWKRDNTILHPNVRTRITQKKKKSTLVIRNLSEADWGKYDCIARGVDGTEISNSFPTIGRPTEKPGIYRTTDRKPCNESMETDFCFNGGTCFYVEDMKEYACECAAGFKGKRCDIKSSNQSSMYRQTPQSPCKVGLYTKYDKC